MFTTRIRRGLLSLAAVLGLLAFAAASPASAGAPADIDGVIQVGPSTGFIGDFEIGGEPANPTCPGSTDLDVTFAGSATAGTWEANGTIKVPFQVAFTSDWYQAEFTVIGDGTYLPFDGTIILLMDIQQLDVDGPDDDVASAGDNCAETLLCNTASLLIVDGSSSHTGSLPTPATGDVTNLIADSAAGGVPVQLVSGTCGVTLAGELGNQHVYADLTLTW